LRFSLETRVDLHGEAEHSGQIPVVLEVHQPSVILGRSGKLDMEVNADACENDAVPVLRRQSGGGAVLLASDVAYTLILNLERRPHLRDVESKLPPQFSTLSFRAAGQPGLLAIAAT